MEYMNNQQNMDPRNPVKEVSPKPRSGEGAKRISAAAKNVLSTDPMIADRRDKMHLHADNNTQSADVSAAEVAQVPATPRVCRTNKTCVYKFRYSRAQEAIAARREIINGMREAQEVETASFLSPNHEINLVISKAIASTNGVSSDAPWQQNLAAVNVSFGQNLRGFTRRVFQKAQEGKINTRA